MAEKIDPVTEKPLVEATTTAVVDDPAALESDAPRPDRDLTRAIYTIVCGVALPCIPIIVVSAVLLYFIFHYRVIPRAGWPELYISPDQAGGINNVTDLIKTLRHDGGKPAYFVQYNPSTITTIASWTGRVIPYLSSSIMALVAFFAARHIVLKSKRGHHNDLPTPEQLTILISLLGGSGFGPLKDTVLYRWGKRRRLVAPLPAAFTALFIITFLGLLIPLVDTWFGIATHPATITQLYNTSRQEYHSFGRALNKNETLLNPSCANGPGLAAGTGTNYQKWWWPCNIIMLSTALSNIFLQGVQDASELQLSQPTNNLIFNYTSAVDVTAGPGGKATRTVYFFGDARSDSKVDYKAQTLGISTQCQMATADCYTGDNGTAFRCSAGFRGDLWACQPDSWYGGNGSHCSTGIGFAPDAQLSRSAGFTTLTDTSQEGTGYNWGEIPVLLRQNPMHFAAWAYGYPTADMNNKLWSTFDQQIFPNNTIVAQWLVNCSATVHDVTYTYVDGALHSFAATPAAAEWGGFFSAPFAWSGLDGMQPAKLALEQAAYLASYTAQSSSDMASIWAHEFSKSALAMSVGVFAPAINELEQLRNSTVNVARVPTVPLYLLLGLKLLYVVTVVVLAIGAYCFTHPAETEVVKAQLSVKGLAAAHFDRPDLLRESVVKEVQSRLDQAGGGDSGSAGNGGGNDGGGPSNPKQPLHRAATDPTGSHTQQRAQGEGETEEEHAPKVGLMPTRAGTWQFVLLANGAWQSVKPLVQSLVLSEAKAGELGAVGDVYAAWK